MASNFIKNSNIFNKKPALHFINISLISIAAFVVYSNSLNGIWALDDLFINSTVAIDEVLNLNKSRIISYLTFLINQKINPYDQFNFRILNLLIHVINSVLIYCISFITIKNYKNFGKNNSIQFYIPFMSSLLFAVHPLNINAVAYIIQRMASLSTLFSLLSLLSYIFASKSGAYLKKYMLYFASVVCFICAILSKENGIMLIPLLLLYDYFFISCFSIKIFARKILFFLGLSLISILLASYFINILGSIKSVINVFINFNKPIISNSWTAIDVNWTPYEHILTEYRIISRYLILFFSPIPKMLVFDWWGFPISTGLLSPLTTLISILFIFSLLFFSVLKIKEYPFLSFGILWYFIAISLESFIAVGLDLYFEHRNYLPLVGLCFGIITQVILFSEKWLRLKYVKLIVAIIIFLFFGGMTFQRNFVWRDSIVFWKDITEKASENVRAFNALGNLSFARSNFVDAENYYKNAIKIAKEKKSHTYIVDSLYKLGFMYLLLERLESAKKIIEVMEKLYGNTWEFYILQGMYLHTNHDYMNALDNYDKALRVFKSSKFADKATILTLMGESFRMLGQYKEAYTYYKTALNVSPAMAAAYHGISKLQVAQGKFDSAKVNLNEALKFDPYNIMVLNDMANLMLIQGNKVRDALIYAKKAIELNPPMFQPYLVMGTIEVASGNESEAERMFIKAKELKASDYQILFNMAWGYSITGDTEKQTQCLKEILKIKDTPDNIKNTVSRILLNLKRNKLEKN